MFGNVKQRIIRIFGHQVQAVGLHLEALYGKLCIYKAYSYTAVMWRQAAVYHQYVAFTAIKDAGGEAFFIKGLL